MSTDFNLSPRSEDLPHHDEQVPVQFAASAWSLLHCYQAFVNQFVHQRPPRTQDKFNLLSFTTMRMSETNSITRATGCQVVRSVCRLSSSSSSRSTANSFQNRRVIAAFVILMIICDPVQGAFGSRYSSSNPGGASGASNNNNNRRPNPRIPLQASLSTSVKSKRRRRRQQQQRETSILTTTTTLGDTSLSLAASSSSSSQDEGSPTSEEESSSSLSEEAKIMEVETVLATNELDATADAAAAATSSSKLILLACLAGLSALVSLSAYVGILPGYAGENTLSLIEQDTVATWICAALAYALVKGNNYFYSKEVYGPNIARKVVHILSGPLFFFMFPIFTSASGAKYFAGIVSLSNMIQLYLSGKNIGDPTLAKAVSRSGDRSEALGGPLIYILILQASILLFWRTSPIGIVAICTMAFGDGMADLIGRKWGRTNKWFFSDSKSMVGSLAFVTFSTLASFGLIQWLAYTDCLTTMPSSLSTLDILWRVLGISVASAVIELIPFGDDNITVPAAAGLLAAFFLQ